MSEVSRPKSRFVPVSEEDFNQYAKNFAWLTGLSLSKAKETLSELYGFPSFYEMRKILAQGDLTPGPFSPSTVPPFLSADEASLLNSDACIPATSEEYRSRRTKMLHWGEGADITRLRQVALVESGFFCTPKLHKFLFKTSKRGILAVESKDLKELEDFFKHHWPVGLWGLLEWLYDSPLNLDETGLSRLEVLRAKGPTEQRESLWAFKAAQIYKRLTQAVHAGKLEAHWGYDEIPVPEKPQGKPGMYDLSFFNAWGEPCIDIGEVLLDASDEAYDIVCEALNENSFDPAKNPKLKEILSEQQLLALKEACYDYRYAQLKSYSSAMDSSSGLVEELLTECKPLPMLKEQTYLNAYVAISEVESFQANFGDSSGVQLLRMSATFFQNSERSLEPATAVGAANGFLLVPYDNFYVCNDETWFEALDCVSAMLNDVWKVLQVDYFPGQGMHNIEEFTVDKPFASIAVLSFELLPEFRGKGYVPHLMNAISGALEDHPYTAMDENWYQMADQMAVDTEDLDDLEPCPVKSGVRSLSSPAVFVLPVEGAEASDRSMYPHLRDSLVRIKKDARDPQEIRKRKLMAHFKAMEPALQLRNFDEKVSIVCYEPFEWPST